MLWTGARGARRSGTAKHGPDAEPGGRVTGAGRVREAVTRNKQDKLTALLHHLTVDVLRASFFGLKKSAAPGVDEMTWTEYVERLEENLWTSTLAFRRQRIERDAPD